MCGITGFTGRSNANLLRSMNSKLSHRGPDGEGFLMNDLVSFSMRRLAIIDLKTGDQPVFSEDKNIAVVFNGEIYNFKILRKLLEAKKHKFITSSDTEVLAHGYE